MWLYKSVTMTLLIVLVSVLSACTSSDDDKLVIEQGVNRDHYTFKNPSIPKEGAVITINHSKLTKFIKTKDGSLYVYSNLICSANGVPLSANGYIVQDDNDNYVLRYQTTEGKQSHDVDCGGIYKVIEDEKQ